jgi:predicted DNA-binding protein
MYATYIMKRTQIYLDDEQDKILARRAREKGTTKSSLIRDAITEYIASTTEDDEKARLEAFKAAVRAFADHPLTYLPDGKTYVENLRKADLAREKELERRWRQ